MVILELIHATKSGPEMERTLLLDQNHSPGLSGRCFGESR